jgi:hypothetical protein
MRKKKMMTKTENPPTIVIYITYLIKKGALYDTFFIELC